MALTAEGEHMTNCISERWVNEFPIWMALHCFFPHFNAVNHSDLLTSLTIFPPPEILPILSFPSHHRNHG
jgi:hypothetical protein